MRALLPARPPAVAAPARSIRTGAATPAGDETHRAKSGLRIQSVALPHARAEDSRGSHNQWQGAHRLQRRAPRESTDNHALFPRAEGQTTPVLRAFSVGYLSQWSRNQIQIAPSPVRAIRRRRCAITRNKLFSLFQCRGYPSRASAARRLRVFRRERENVAEGHPRYRRPARSVQRDIATDDVRHSSNRRIQSP